MNRSQKLLIFLGILSISFLFAKNGSAVGPTEINSDITTETVWSKANNPYVIKRSINVNAPLVIESGTIIKFTNEAVDHTPSGLKVGSGSLTAIGSAQEKIVFTSTSDSSYGGDTSVYSAWWSNKYPRRGDWGGLTLYDSSGSIYIENAIIYYASRAIVYQSVNKAYYEGLEIKNSEIANNSIGIYLRNVEAKLQNLSVHDNDNGIEVFTPSKNARISSIRNSAIFDNGAGVRMDAYYVSQRGFFDARYNWWGDASGPYYKKYYLIGQEEDNLDGLGNWVNDGVYFTPWLNIEPKMGEKPACQENCHSNVLFLPGAKASRLYKYDSDTDKDLDELWVPNWFGNDVEELKLDSDGKSIEEVFVKEGGVLRSTVMGNLYKSFLNDLEKLKIEDTINDYKSFAYDWRKNVEDIAKNGTLYEGEQIKSIISEISALAQNSKSKKVTIVAHSNGGLVAKAVMMELERLGLADKVDKIILVASPQMGTPLATLSFLYGYEESLPTLLSQAQARELVENMPGAYGLLPNSEYFSRTEESIINFSSENTERGDMFIKAYGEKIDNFGEFKDFLLAKKDNREKPESEEIDLENILNEKLLTEAIDMHSKIDDWTPPASVEVIQLAGWGLPTVSGINYTEKKNATCLQSELSKLPVCAEEEGKYTFIYEPKFTADGDEVVVAPSALTMSKSDNVRNYWFDLYRNNKEANEAWKHKDILEAISVRDFIKNEIQNSGADLPEYFGTEKPADFENMAPKIRMSLYSPLDIHLYDSAGNHTGYKEIQTDEGPQRIIEEGVFNSYYMQLGDRKYVGFEKGEDMEIKLDGYAEGVYTLKIEEVKYREGGEEIINHITFKNLPASDKTQVRLTIPASGLENISSLRADYDGDGDDDYILDPILGGEVMMPDMTPPNIDIISPKDKSYQKDEILDIAYEVSDDRSKRDNIETKVFLDDKEFTEDKVDLSLLKTGKHKLTVEAIDEADNESSEEAEFEIITDIGILRENLEHFYDLELIKSAQEKNMILNNLEMIQKESEFQDNKENFKSEVIEKHIEILGKKIEEDKKNYDIMIKEIIISDLEFIKINNN